MEYYYDDPLAAAWMMKHFEVHFGDFSEQLEIIMSPIGSRFYVSDESKRVFLFKENDLVHRNSYLLIEAIIKENKEEKKNRNFLIEVLLGAPVATAGRKIGLSQGRARSYFLRSLQQQYPQIQPNYSLEHFYAFFDDFREKLITKKFVENEIAPPQLIIIQRNGIPFMWPKTEQPNPINT